MDSTRCPSLGFARRISTRQTSRPRGRPGRSWLRRRNFYKNSWSSCRGNTAGSRPAVRSQPGGCRSTGPTGSGTGSWACRVKGELASPSPPCTPSFPQPRSCWRRDPDVLIGRFIFFSQRIEDMRKRHVEVSQPPLAPGPGERAVGGGMMDPNTTGEEGTGRGPLLPISTPPPQGWAEKGDASLGDSGGCSPGVGPCLAPQLVQGDTHMKPTPTGA